MKKIIVGLILGFSSVCAFAQGLEKNNLKKWAETQTETGLVQLKNGKTFYQDFNKSGSKVILFVHGGTIPS